MAKAQTNNEDEQSENLETSLPTIETNIKVSVKDLNASGKSASFEFKVIFWSEEAAVTE